MMASPRRIDVHFHLIPPFYREAVYAAGRGPAIGKCPDWTPELALDVMDAHGIEVALTSLAQPGVGFGGAASAQALARRCNGHGADPGAPWPTRFVAFGTVPMWSTQGALDEIAHSLDVLKFDGVSLFASYGENFLGDPGFDPLLAMLNERGAVVFVHPGLHPSSKGLALPWPAFMMEYLFDTTRAAGNLIFSGAIERFPRVRFILPHAGGLAPYFAWRLSVSPMIDPRLPQLARAQVYAGSSVSGTTTRSRPGNRPSARSIMSPRRSASCSAPIIRSPIRASSPRWSRPTNPGSFRRPGAPRSTAPTRSRCFRNTADGRAVPRTPSCIDQATASPKVSGDARRSCQSWVIRTRSTSTP